MLVVISHVCLRGLVSGLCWVVVVCLIMFVFVDALVVLCGFDVGFGVVVYCGCLLFDLVMGLWFAYCLCLMASCCLFGGWVFGYWL